MIGFFMDSGLSQPAASLMATAAADGSGSSDHRFFLGGTDATRAHVAASDPGVDPIEVSISDNQNGFYPLVATALRLATTQGGLDTAAPGDPLTLGSSLAGGAAHAVAVWVRVDAPAIAVDIYDNLALTTNALISRAV